MALPTSEVASAWNLGWFTPLWTAIASGVIVIVFQRTWKVIGKWQENRKTVDEKDRKLLYEMRDVLMDKPPGHFSKGTKGLVTQVSDLTENLATVDSKVDQVLDRLPPASK